MVLWAVLAVVVGLGVWLYVELRPEPQPDVEKAAHSAAAREADRVLTARLDGQVEKVKVGLPWATYLGTTVADVCSTDTVRRGFSFTRERWLPVTCTRTTTVYEAFDGDFRERLGQLDAALAAAGWSAGWTGNPMYKGQQPGLVAALDYVYGARAKPGPVRVQYGVPIRDDFVSQDPGGPNRAPNGEVEVVQGPGLPSLDGGTYLHDVYLKYPTVKTKYYVDWQPYSRERLAADAYPAHSTVVAITVTGSYNTGP
ncbi:hypothetical protein [Kitasatospora sp. NPDC101183]|uniref:hypothetical protein n=1 Tax=Kitasatospora sp. NPDC101183 TaxID=3364100 RepID=UPI00380E0D19